MNRQEENKALIHWQLCPKAPLFPMDCFAYYKHGFPKIHYSSIAQAKTLLQALPSPSQFVKTLPSLAWLKYSPAEEAPGQPALALCSITPSTLLHSALYKNKNHPPPNS